MPERLECAYDLCRRARPEAKDERSAVDTVRSGRACLCHAPMRRFLPAKIVRAPELLGRMLDETNII